MGVRGTLWLALLTLVVVVAYFFAFEEKPPELPRVTLLGEPLYVDPSAPKEYVLRFDPELVRRVLLVQHGAVRSAERSGSRWRGSRKRGAPDEFLESLRELVVLTTIGSAGLDLADYGLAPPSRQVVLEFSGRPPTRLSIGDRNPSGTAVYVRVGDGPVLLVGSLLLWEFEKAYAAFEESEAQRNAS
ncbi:MAG: hypothetical protein KatS3mg076_0766 [Candidatus Binatia bacterium]|nr:MAG: hypothetical protein KatS3mg076_0766 [Candidatus Binatia bacterium]